MLKTSESTNTLRTAIREIKTTQHSEQREHKCMYENLFAYLCRLLKEALEKIKAQHPAADGLQAAKLEGEIM
jgi:hypothetical protein